MGGYSKAAKVQVSRSTSVQEQECHEEEGVSCTSLPTFPLNDPDSLLLEPKKPHEGLSPSRRVCKRFFQGSTFHLCSQSPRAKGTVSLQVLRRSVVLALLLSAAMQSGESKYSMDHNGNFRGGHSWHRGVYSGVSPGCWNRAGQGALLGGGSVKERAAFLCSVLLWERR